MNTLFCGIKLLESHQIISSKFPIPRNHSTTPKSCKQGQGTITGLSDLEPALGSTSSEPAFKSTSQLSDHQKVKLIRNIHKPFASHLASSSLDSRFESTLSQPESPIYQWTPYFAGSNCRNLIKSYLPNFPFQEIIPPPQSLVSKAKVQSWACQISSQLWDQPPVYQLSDPLLSPSQLSGPLPAPPFRVWTGGMLQSWGLVATTASWRYSHGKYVYIVFTVICIFNI